MNKIEFYKETNFKETPIGKIPREWEIVRASEVAEYINGYPFGPEDWKTKGIPIIRIQNLNDPDAEFNYFDGEIDEIYKVRNGDLLFSWSGSIGVYLWNRGDAVLNQHIFKVIPKPNVDKFFLYYALFLAIEQLKMRTHGSTMKHFRRGELRSTIIPFPPVEEQRAVAGVLSVVDLAIQRTDMVIAKTERLKKGLMQTLLTKGIGHKEFKDTEIGKIPKTWQIVSLKDVVVEAKSGFACGQRDENGILQLRMDNIDPEGWINMEAGVKVPPPPDVEDYILKPGDILFNNTNSVDLIGKTAIFRGEFPRCVYSNHITRIRVNQKKIVPEWILYLLIRKWELGVFKAICHRHVHQAGINNEDLLRLKIPLPPIEEQQAIVSTILANDNVLKFQRNEKAKLERIKQGLMDLLLTGKVRVKVIK